MKVIHKEAWSHILMEENGVLFLTVSIPCGIAQYSMSLKLTKEEEERINGSEEALKVLVKDVARNSEKYKSREVKPVVWPDP